MKHLDQRIGPHKITKVVVTDADGDEHEFTGAAYARVADLQATGQPRRRTLSIHMPIDHTEERPTT